MCLDDDIRIFASTKAMSADLQGDCESYTVTLVSHPCLSASFQPLGSESPDRLSWLLDLPEMSVRERLLNRISQSQEKLRTIFFASAGLL